MIYIHKIQLPESLDKYNKDQIDNNLMPEYSGNWKRDEFRELVAKEQNDICCYCNNTIAKDRDNSTIEHFLPESVFKEEATNYYNLFLACNEKSNQQKRAPRFQHCDASDEAKANKLIPKYISHPLCENFFAYNISGEILPYCQYKSIDSCNDNYRNLTDEQKMLLSTIDVLKLNVDSLMAARKYQYEIYFAQIVSMNGDTLLKELNDYYDRKNTLSFQRFCGIYYYLLRNRLEILEKKDEFWKIVNNWKARLSSSHIVITHKI